MEVACGRGGKSGAYLGIIHVRGVTPHEHEGKRGAREEKQQLLRKGERSILVGRIQTLMHPFQLYWKNYLLPAGITLVSLWMLYLGVSVIFTPMDSPSDQGDARSSSRNSFFSDGGAAQSDSPSNAGSKSRGVENKSLTAKNTLKVGVVGGKSSGALGRLMSGADFAAAKDVLPGGSKISLAAASARAALHESIMKEAYTLALKSENPSKNLIAVAMEHYRRGEKEGAREVLRMAEKMAANPDDQLAASVAVREVVKAMLSQRQTDDALAALQNIQNPRERERAIAEIAAWSARQGEVDMARSLIGQIINGRDRDVALIAIAENEAAYESASVAMQTASNIVNVLKKDDAYRRIALKRGALKDFSGADLSVQMIMTAKLKDSTMVSLARQRARTGDVDGGLQMVQNVTDQSLIDTSLREIATELAALGQFSTSAYITTRIRDERERSYALESISVEQARSGYLSAALVRTDSIPIDSIRERTLRYVSGVTADEGSPARARNVAIRINSNKERDRAYRSIAQAATADGDHVAAYNTLQEINRPEEKAMALVSMARTRQKQGGSRQALAMLEDASRESRSLTSVRTVDRIQSNMAVAYAERHESGHSLLLADNIINARQRDTTYGSLARTFVRHDDIQAAQESLLSISSEKIRLKAEDAVAQTLAQKVSPQNALSKARSLNSGRQQIVFLLEVLRKT